MLEKASRCVENATEHVVRRCVTRLRSRRMLHTNFWRHGTLDIDIPLWCLSLMQRPQLSALEINQLAREGSSFLKSFTSPQFLDFLYPPYTQSFARSFLTSYRNGSTLRRRKGAAALRGYASSVDKDGEQKAGSHYWQAPTVESGGSAVEEDEGTQDEASLDLRNKVVSTRSLQEVLARKSPREYGLAWKLYEQEGCPRHYASELLHFLSNSNLPADVERSNSIFDSIPVHSRKSSDYLCTTRATLRTKAPRQRVMSICKEAIARHEGESCWNLALAFALNHVDWNLLSALWNLRESLSDGYTRPSVSADQLSFKGLPDRLISLLDAIVNKEIPSPERDLADLVEFLTRHVLSSKTMIIDTPLASILQIFQRLSTLQFIDTRHYFGALSRLLNLGSRAAVARSVVIYRNFRWRMPHETPPDWLLKRIVFKASKFQMAESLEYVLNQFRLFYEKPPEELYQSALITYSKLGEVSLVRQTFDKLVEDHGSPSNQRLVSPLLYVHARLGDVKRTKSQFEKLSHEYSVSENVVFWNILLTAYLKAGDLNGAISTFGDIGRAGVSPDSHSFGIIMALLAKRGDVTAVKKLADAAKRGGVSVTAPMVDTIVEALCRSGRFVEAEEVAREACTMHPPVGVTRSWNILLLNYAFRADVDSVSRIQAQMQQLGIKFDDMTYAAMMLSLVFIRDTESARKILRKLHRGRHIHVNEFHYSIILHGYFQERNLDMVHVLYKEMEERFGKVGPSADLVMLRTLIKQDVLRFEEKGGAESGQPVEFNNSERFLESVMERFGVSDYAASRPQPGTKRRTPREAFPSSYYESLMGAYGWKRGFSRAEELGEQYVSDAKHLSNSDSQPLQHLYVLMEQYFQRDEHDMVESCWKTALERIRQVSAPVDINPLLPASQQEASAQPPEDTSLRDKPDSVIQCNRFALSKYLCLYMQSLVARNLLPRIDNVISDIERMGFELTSKDWSLYIKMLCRSSQPAERLRAFVIFEEKYVDNFPGWPETRRGLVKRPPDAHDGLALLDAPRVTDEGTIGKHARRTWANIQPNYMQPTYLTMMHLASVLVDVRMQTVAGGAKEMADLFSKAPKTVKALSTLPYLRSRFHRRVLRRRSLPPNVIKGVKTTFQNVSTSGLLGVDGEPRIDTRPREVASKKARKENQMAATSEYPDAHRYVASPYPEVDSPPETSEPSIEDLQTILAQDAEWRRTLGRREDETAEDVRPERTLAPEDEQDIEYESHAPRVTGRRADRGSAQKKQDGNVAVPSFQEPAGKPEI